MPLEVAGLLCAGCIAAGLWGGRIHANSRVDRRRSPLDSLFKPDVLSEAVDLAARRNAMRAASHAVLQGRIDQFHTQGAHWSNDARAEVREHIAAVMRASLRRGDRMTQEEGNAFVITIAGADERAAINIADRLRRRLSQLSLPQLTGGGHVTASFGVASERFGDSEGAVAQRARRALEAAIAKGADHVVPASEIEEIMFLPAPAPSPAQAEGPEASPGPSASAA